MIDTNILVSTLISSAGPQAQLLRAVEADLMQPCYSTEIFDEYERVLSRSKFGFATDEIARVLGLMILRGRVASSADPAVHSPDPSDTKFITCAMTAKADYLVTGNRRHFPEPIYGVTRVVDARTLLQRPDPASVRDT